MDFREVFPEVHGPCCGDPAGVFVGGGFFVGVFARAVDEDAGFFVDWLPGVAGEGGGAGG